MFVGHHTVLVHLRHLLILQQLNPVVCDLARPPLRAELGVVGGGLGCLEKLGELGVVEGGWGVLGVVEACWKRLVAWW